MEGREKESVVSVKEIGKETALPIGKRESTNCPIAGYCEVLGRFFVDREEIADFCAKQKADLVPCLKCKKEAPPKVEAKEIELSPALLQEIRALVSAECANHLNTGPLRIKNYCWMQEKSNEGICVFFSDLKSPRCGYFENAVLPLNVELEEEIKQKEEGYGRTEIEDRQPDSGKEPGRRPGHIKIDFGKVQVRRLSVVKPGGESLLSGGRIYGVDSRKEEKGQ